MAELPVGTVTFLFSDIENSTQTLQRLGAEGYARVLAESQALLRALWVAHGGGEVDTAGDGFFVAFSSAPQAVAAAAEAIRALAEYSWPEGGVIRVRIGLHTGSPQLVGDHYVGLDVHRAARIAAAGHGGQVLLSEATRGLVEQDLPAGVSLRDLGPQRLKDLQHAERVSQLILPGLPSEFPALKTLDRHSHNLPIEPTALLGREEALAAVCARLRRDDARLVTLTGPGGVGKTRLALEAAAELVDDFADGVWLVRLSRLSDPGLVIATIAQTLGLKEVGGQPISETVREYLRARAVLLVLDNFEHLIQAASAVADLLRDCPGLKALVTSRVPLRLRGEKALALAPLTLAPLASDRELLTADQLAQYAAVALFIQRAQDASADFTVTSANAPAIAEICARLDGLPLAIELAATRVKLLGPEALLARLSGQLKLLSAGARDLEARQQTMRATIAWSEQLLTAAERALFRRLAVFAGGATLEAIEAVCLTPDGGEPLAVDALDGLGALVDQSLVQQREEAGAPRFSMLHVIREYALERLEASGEEKSIRRAHLAYFVTLSERFAGEVHSPHADDLMAQLEREIDNLRGALWWSLATDVDHAARLDDALSDFWTVHGHWIEGRQWNARILATGEQLSPSLRAALLGKDGYLARLQGDLVLARARLTESLAIARGVGDQGIAGAALEQFAYIALAEGQFERAERLFAEYLGSQQATNDRGAELRVLRGQAGLAVMRGDAAQHRRLLKQAFKLARELGDTHEIAGCAHEFGVLAMIDGEYDVAERQLREAYADQTRLHDINCSAATLDDLARLALERGEIGAALEQSERSVAMHEAIAAQPMLALDLVTLAEARLAAGDLRGAEEACLAALRIEQRVKNRRHTAHALTSLAQVAFAQPARERVARLLGASAGALGAWAPYLWPPRIAAQHAMAASETQMALGEAAWTALYKAGRRLSLDEAIAQTLAGEESGADG
jgi:predicted ATPase/class 3 adenylate cyclase